MQQDPSQKRVYQYEYAETRLWQQARQLVKWVYVLVRQMKEEEHTLMQKNIFQTALDIPSSIAESYAKPLPPDAVRKLHQARHSTFKLENLFYLGFDMKAISEEELEDLLLKTGEIKTLISARTRQFKKKPS